MLHLIVIGFPGNSVSINCIRGLFLYLLVSLASRMFDLEIEANTLIWDLAKLNFIIVVSY